MLAGLVEKPILSYPTGSVASGEKTHDIYNYTLLVRYFKGESLENPVIPPFRYRILAPFLAAYLPFSPLTSLNIINVLFHLAALLFLTFIFQWHHFSSFERNAGLLIYIVSYPMIMFGSTGWNEPVAIGFICAGIYFVIRNMKLLLIMTILLGSINNEKIVLLVVFAAAYSWSHGRIKDAILYALVTMLVQYLLRVIDYGVLFGGDNINRNLAPFSWYPQLGYIKLNLITRWSNYPSSILTFGLIGLFSLRFIQQRLYFRYKEFIPYAIGFSVACAMYAYGITTAYASGRILWYIYPFGIVLTLQYLRHMRMHPLP